MSLDESLNAIEKCATLEELRAALQSIVAAYGFASYGFIDSTHLGRLDPLFVSTHDPVWIETYAREGFIDVDPCMSKAHRTNKLFNWGSVKLPAFLGRKKPGAVKIMEAAQDFGFQEGVTIPFHYNDRLGRRYSSVCTFIWKNSLADFRKTFEINKAELHLILLYWAQKIVDLNAVQKKLQPRFLDHDGAPLDKVRLTDREKDVICWAGRGKTVAETAEILKISYDTVETHMRNAMQKLGADTKTHAVVKAVYLGLVDI